MRQNRFIATKDHFIMLAASNEVGDELWAGNLEFRNKNFTPSTTNAIGFLVRGSVNSFHNTSNAGESWVHYKSAEAPLMLIRDNFVDFGIVATSNSTLFGSILSKNNLLAGQNEYLISSNLNETEMAGISSSETINANKKCKVYQKRDVNTFEGIEQEVLNIHTIADSEIELDGV